MEIQRIIQKSTQTIRKHLPDQEWELLLFGSQSKKTARDRSDIDIAIRGKKAVPLVVMHHIKEDIDQISTLRKIDIVDLSRTSTAFQHRVSQEGKQLQA
ncbi:MAG: nucleotidyltransferase domain-containing protein [Candidatus Magasanikbacteria bacterium]|nr:nucleotidyltransferase domain-containing protein [Candidatus Magasanikbacteria bacterium]